MKKKSIFQSRGGVFFSSIKNSLRAKFKSLKRIVYTFLYTRL
jgi:hypothetical protein